MHNGSPALCLHSELADQLISLVEILEPVDKPLLVAAIRKVQVELRKKTKNGRRLLVEDMNAENLTYSWQAIQELEGQVFEDTTHLIVAFRRARGRCVYKETVSIPRTDAMHTAHGTDSDLVDERTNTAADLDIDGLPLSEDALNVMRTCVAWSELHGKAPSNVTIAEVTGIERTRKLPKVLEEISAYLHRTST